MMINNTIGLQGLLKDERSWMLALAQSAAYLFETIPELNWCGFYLYDSRSNQLKLGPFQGRVACTSIPLSKGVCGKAYGTQEIQVVPDVHAVADHIACDARSQSELVIPLFLEKNCWGVLDLDSPVKGRFTEQQEGRRLSQDFHQALAQSHLSYSTLQAFISTCY